MSKTYDLTATLNTGHLNGSDTMEPSWSNFLTWNEASANVGYSGYDNPYWRYATNMIFDQASLTALRSKTVTAVTLTVNCTQAMTGETLIGYKLNSTASGNGSSNAWTRGNNNGTAGSGEATVAYLIPAHTLATGSRTFTLKTAVPQYGLVAGPQTNVTGRWRFSSAVLHVTTNEVTVNYYKGANGTGNNVTDVITPGGNLRGVTYTRTGYTQTGWSTTDGGSKAYNLSATYSGTSDLTLYPFWTANTYTISYNANGGTGAPASQTKTYGVNLTLQSGTPTRSQSSAGSYTVSYNANGGSVSPASASAARTSTYTFSKWNTAANGSGTNYNAGGTYSANAAATLYAQWATTTTTAAVTLPTPTRSNYNFNGWYTAASGGTRVGGGGSSYTPTGAVTLYAQWTASAATLGDISTSVICGNNFTANWTSTGATYKYKVTITCGNATAATSGVTAANAQTATVQVPTSWYSMSNGPMKSSMSATATCTLTTYANDGTTQIGTVSTKTFEVKVPTTVVPTKTAFTATGSSNNSTVSGWGSSYIVQGYSFVNLSLTASPGAGAAISSVRFYGQGLDTSGTSLTARTPNVIDVAGSFTYTAVYTDTRGQYSTWTVAASVYPYSVPNISAIAVARCNNDPPNYTVNNGSGLYFKATPSYSISPVNSKNAITSQTIQYKLHTSSSWSPAATCANNTMSGPWSCTITSAYDVMVTVSDRLNTSTFTVTLPGASGIWYGKGNDRLGLGAPPEDAGLWCDWDATFKGVVDVTQRRCRATLSSEGWYRVLKTADVSGTIINFYIGRPYGSHQAETHKISFHVVGGGKSAFVEETSDSNSLFVNKIRCTYGGGYMYFDVHYSTSSYTNEVLVYFDVYGKGQANGTSVSMGLTKVADSPPGETVSADLEYSFSGNTERPGTITAGSYTELFYDGTYLYRQGQMVTGFIKAKMNATVPASAWRNIAVIPVGFRPYSSVDFLAINNAANNAGELHIQARIEQSTGNVVIWPYTAIASGTAIYLSFAYRAYSTN